MRNLLTIVGLEINGKINNFYNRLTRTHFISGAFIFLGLLSAALFINAIVQGYHNHKHNTHPNNIDQYCLNQGCLSAATHQLNFMNHSASANRCIDFYNYACGGWQQSHPIQSFNIERTILGDIIDERDADIERLLNSPISRLSSQTWEWKVKTYYSECLNDYARLPNSGKIIVGLIQDSHTINGWFLFDNSVENSSQEFLLINQTVYQQISYIHGELGVNVGFDLRVKFDDTDRNIKRLEFFPAGLSMKINDYLGNDTVSERRRSIYQLYILEILTLLAQEAEISDGNLSNRMLTIANDIFTFEQTLAEYLQFNNDHDETTITMTLQDMSNQYSFDFVQLIKHEIDNISETTLIYVTNPTYFYKTFLLLSNNNNNASIARIIHNYMRWRLIRTYIEDLSYNYIHTHRIFLNNYYNNVLHLSNEVYCKREIIRKFPLAIQRLYTMNTKIHSDIIQTIFNSLKKGFLKYINEQTTWMIDETTKRIAREKMNDLTIAIGYASIIFDDIQLDNYYEKVVVDDKSHIENAYNYHHFHRWTISNSLANPNQFEHWDFFQTHTNQLFDYIAIFNRLFVIANAMHEPLINIEWPWAMNIGSLGVLFAQKLFSSIDESKNHINSMNNIYIPDWWSVSTANAYNSSYQCLADYYRNHIKTLSYNVIDEQLSVQLTGKPFAQTTFRHIVALRFAYITLKIMTNSSMTKSWKKMPGTELTNEQTFFLAYAQTQCYQRQELIQYVQTLSGIYDEKLALNTALIHMPEFIEVFQCQYKEKTCVFV